MTRSFLQMLTAAGCIAAAAIAPATCAEISGAGATFPFPIYAQWADAYKKETGVGITYQPLGSSEGIRQIQDKEVTSGRGFGAGDSRQGKLGGFVAPAGESARLTNT
jgi:phosphate transport system substrate-binding protein